jgi:hypothetical protein
MNRSAAGQRAIDQSFAAISGVRSFTSFSRVTPEQKECVELTNAHAERVFANKARDLYLKALVVCITGYDDYDEDEPITEDSFSQHRFYSTYVHDLVYFPDRFDFLLQCVMHQVCIVQRPPKFKELLRTLLQNDAEHAVPDEVLNYDRLLVEDDERRVDHFVMRKDWKCQVPPLGEVTARAVERQAAQQAAADSPKF